MYNDLRANTENAQGLSAEDVYTHPSYRSVNTFGWKPTELSNYNLDKWANNLPRQRVDIQAVLTVLGRRTDSLRLIEQSKSFVLDLSESNLQKTKIEGNFDGANFSNTRLDGAELIGKFHRIDASETSCQSMRAPGIKATNIDFSAANLSAAFFAGAELNGAKLWFAKMWYTNFNAASLVGSDWYGATPENVYFYEEADASWARFQDINLNQLRGLNISISHDMWIDGSVEMSNPLEKLFPRISKGFEPELDFRRKWNNAKSAANIV